MPESNWKFWINKLGIELQPIADSIVAGEQSEMIQRHVAADIPGEFQFTSPSSLFLSNRDGTDRSLIWLPMPLPVRSTVCIASSRMGQQLSNYPTWLAAMRTVLCRLDPTSEAILTAEQTTTHKLCQRGSELFRVPLFQISRIPKTASRRWFAKQAAAPLPANVYRIFVAVDSHFLPVANDAAGADSVDRLLIGMARRVQLLSVRKGGNIERAVRQRTRHLGPDAITWILNDDQLTEPALRKSLVAGGCIDWVLQTEPAGSSTVTAKSIRSRKLTALPDNLDDFLFHWTRGASIRVSGKAHRPLLDRLLFRTASDLNGAVATLLEILGTQTIHGNSTLTRDSIPVVSLTESRLDQWQQLRKFRGHLGRWDFEPFGIALRRSIVEKIHGRPVVYGDESTWEKFDLSLRPYFQIAESTRGKKKIDWRQEREWRTVGDIDLRQFGPTDAFLFVADTTCVELLSAFSRWPVVVLPQ